MNNFSHKWTHRLHIFQRLASKYFYKILGKQNHKLQRQEKYFIKKGYHHALNAETFNDTSNTDEWQAEVYRYAADFMTSHQYHTLIDVGCGSAFKLIKYLDQFNTTGIEVGETYTWLKKTYPHKRWLQMGGEPGNLSTDLIICSDVIEHIPDPDQLLSYMQSINSKHIIISTPERDAVAGKNDYGPPENSSHYREWSLEEFNRYISNWFEVEEQRLFAGRSVSQVIVCTRKKKLGPG